MVQHVIQLRVLYNLEVLRHFGNRLSEVIGPAMKICYQWGEHLANKVVNSTGGVTWQPILL
jgi:hypothetical protein